MDLENKHPLHEGVSREHAFYPDDIPQEQPSSTTPVTLVELCRDYHFFTPFLLFEFGDLRHDIVSEYTATRDPTCKPILRLFQQPIFDGFGTRTVNGVPAPALGHMLYQVPSAQWPNLCSFILGMGVIDRDRKLFYHVALQHITIADPVFLERASVLPTAGYPALVVTAFGIDGNNAQIGFSQAKKPPMDRPRVLHAPPRDTMVTFADALFNYCDKPYTQVETSKTWTPI